MLLAMSGKVETSLREKPGISKLKRSTRQKHRALEL
jgi:hypothetical protein